MLAATSQDPAAAGGTIPVTSDLLAGDGAGNAVASKVVVSGPTASRTKTFRDAADTVLELGGSYTPTGTWTSVNLVTPVLGTPASGNLANCTFPTLNQSTSGNAATATALASLRTIGGSNFDGSANVTSFPAPGPIGGTTPDAGTFTSVSGSANGSSSAPLFARGNSGFYFSASGGNIYITQGGTYSGGFFGGVWSIPNATLIGFESGGAASSLDVALARNAAGVLEVNNGNAGTYRDIKTRNHLLTGTITSYNGVATVGLGIPVLVASGRAAGVSSLQSSICTFTPSVDASFQVSGNINIITVGSASINLQCAYTDETNTSRTVNLGMCTTTGKTIGDAATSAVAWQGLPLNIRAKSGTSITLKTIGTTATLYNVEGFITQLA